MLSDTKQNCNDVEDIHHITPRSLLFGVLQQQCKATSTAPGSRDLPVNIEPSVGLGLGVLAAVDLVDLQLWSMCVIHSYVCLAQNMNATTLQLSLS